MKRFPILILPLFLGCTLVLPLRDEQCETAKDCEVRGFAGAVCVNYLCQKAKVDPMVDPVWGCLGDVVEPVPDTTKNVVLSLRVAYAGDDGPVVGAVVDVCDKLDLDCKGSSANFPKGLTPDAAGAVELSVLQGFDGFVRISHPDIMDSRMFVGRPIVTPPKPRNLQLLRKSEYLLLAAFAKQEVDPLRGSAILLALDCQGESASGVRFEMPIADGKSLEFYLINQAPTPPPTAIATDVDGFGGFLNLPEGLALVRAYRANDDAYIGESSFHVLADTVSYVDVEPTPQ